LERRERHEGSLKMVHGFHCCFSRYVPHGCL